MNQDIPSDCDSCKVAIVAELHYKGFLKEKGLNKLVNILKEEARDILLLGGDYQEGCHYVAPLFTALGTIHPPLGSYAVLGNNDYERCYDEILEQMRLNNIHLLEHKTDTIWHNQQFILVSGIRDPFNIRLNGTSPTLELSESDFVMMLVHTPDYAERVNIENTDLVLAGHTHGGQIRIFGYAPILPSIYGQRFMKGLKYTSAGIPVIITNGVGTSRKNIRIGAKAEVVMITLLRQE